MKKSLTSLILVSSLAASCTNGPGPGPAQDLGSVRAEGRTKYDSKCVVQKEGSMKLQYGLEDSAEVYFEENDEIRMMSNVDVFHLYLDEDLCPFVPSGTQVYLAGTMDSNRNIEYATFILESQYLGE